MGERTVLICRGPNCSEKDPKGEIGDSVRDVLGICDIKDTTVCRKNCANGPNAEIDPGTSDAQIVPGLTSVNAGQAITQALIGE